MSSFQIYHDPWYHGEHVYLAVPLSKSYNDKTGHDYNYLDQVSSGQAENSVIHRTADAYCFNTTATHRGRRVVTGYSGDDYNGSSKTDHTIRREWCDSTTRYRFSHRYNPDHWGWTHNIMWEETVFIPHPSGGVSFVGNQWRYEGFQDLESFVLSKPDSLKRPVTYFQNWSRDGVVSGEEISPTFNPEAYFMQLEVAHMRPPGSLYNLQAETMAKTALAVNNVDNIRTIAGLLSKVVKDGPFGFVKGAVSDFKDKKALRKAADSWLSYRYAYTTTKLDIEAISDYLASNPSWEKGTMVIRGSKQYPLGTLRVKISYLDGFSSDVGRVANALRDSGFGLTAENIWDMIPFSFVVDWFTEVGDLASSLSKSHYLSSRYDFKSFVSSWSWQEFVEIPEGFAKFSSYSRTVDSAPMPWHWPEESSTSQKTVIMRFFDGVSLFTK